MDLKREAQAVAVLLAQADSLDAEAERNTTDADALRWEAAFRTLAAYEAATVERPMLSLAGFAKEFGQPYDRTKEMVRVGRNAKVGGTRRPAYWEAVFLLGEKDVESLQDRAAEQGRKPSTVRQTELKAALALKSSSSARAVLADPEVRAAAKAAIWEIEAEAQSYERQIPVRTLNDQWHDWLNRANTLFTNGARLASETESVSVELDAHAAAARVLYDRLVERQIDAEIRAFMDAEVA
jgi:hypothetical protein